MASQTIERIIEEARQLPPEERRQLREALDHEEQAESEAPSSTNVAPPSANTAETKRRQRVEWLKQHQAEYAGKYVALDGGHLLGVGMTYPEAAQAARSSGAERPYVDYVPVPGSVGFGGW